MKNVSSAAPVSSTLPTNPNNRLKIPRRLTFSTRKNIDIPSPYQLYSQALEYARDENFNAARVVFRRTLSQSPHLIKAWVSWAQMEKRSAGPGSERWNNCRYILQQALTLNPNDPYLIQAWGLMELNKGNLFAACLLLDRCAQVDPKHSPVLKWHVVRQAKHFVTSKKSNV